MEQVSINRELRVLMLEDTLTDAELIEYELRRAGIAFTSLRVETRDAFVRALEDFRPDVILSDYKLPDFNGMAALEIVQRDHPEIPVVMVTGALADTDAVELIHAGARDYVLKDRLARLPAAVQRALSAEQGARARKAAEEALMQSEADMRKLVEHSPVAMLVDVGVDANEKLVMMNQKFTTLFGYTMDDVPDVSHWWPLAYPDEKYREEIKAEWTARVEKAIQRQSDIEPMEITVTCKDGTSRHVRISLASIGSRNIITFEDFTTRRQVEQALQESLDRYTVVTESANDAIICLHPDGSIHLWNKKAQQMFGYSPEEAIGRQLHQLITPERYRSPPAKDQGVWLFGQTGNGPVVNKMFELTAMRRDGTEFPVELSISAMNVNGEWHATGIIRDITERKQMEKNLLKSEIKFRTVYESSSDAIMLFDEQGFFDCNEAALRIFACPTRDEFISKHPVDLSPPTQPGGEDSISLTNERIATAVKDGCIQFEWMCRRLDGTDFFAEILLTAFELDGKSVLQATVRDITERKEAETERLVGAKKLEQSLLQTIEAIGALVEARDPYTAGHQRRVAVLARAIAQEMGLSDDKIYGLYWAATIHDLGKISIPAEILSKPSKLRPIEFELIKTHAQNGYDIIKDAQFPWPVAQMVLQHHERLDGSGYPQALSGDQILIEAKILAVADVVEAMSSHRPYRPSLGLEAALEEITAQRGVLYDPVVVDCCLKLFREKNYDFQAGATP